MKLKLIKSFLLTTVLVLSISTLAFAATPINKQVDGVKVSLTFTNEKLKTGSNEFTISVLDTNGNPIPNANLTVTADMDRSTDMGGDGMEKDKPMMIDLKEGSKKGEYTGMVDLKASGKWILKATVDVQGQKKDIDLPFTVQGAGTNWLIIGGFSGVIILILAGAVILKKKSIKS